MKTLKAENIPENSLFLMCVSYEDRCVGIITDRKNGFNKFKYVIIFKYDDIDYKRQEDNLIKIKEKCHEDGVEHIEIDLSKKFPLNVFESPILQEQVGGIDSVVLDISTFTKQHIFLLLDWFYNMGKWNKLWVVYTRPITYSGPDGKPHLTEGINKIDTIPMLPSYPSISKPLHLILFLGYEKNRALAVYEHIEPEKTTLIIADPPYEPAWKGLSEEYNKYLINLLGENNVKKCSPTDIEKISKLLKSITEDDGYSFIICPLGTKPQAVGIYKYIIEQKHSPAVIYASPQKYGPVYSSGIGDFVLIKKGIQ